MVASIAELTSAATSVRYYARDGLVSENDPGHRLASRWHGRAAEELGLSGPVDAEPFGSLLQGHVPGTGIRLGSIRNGLHRHRPGIDLVLSAPKSVALEALFEGDERVVDGHRQAVDETLDWIESRLLETRVHDRSTGKRPRVRAHGMAAATFRHHASRNHDPQIHTHCVIANMTRTPSARWGSVDPTSLRRNRNLIGAFYRNRLAAKLHDLGFVIVPTLIGRVPGFEIAGYDQAFLDAFSSRRREILEHLDRLGLPRTSRAAGFAALVTRRRKIDRRLDALRPEWRAQAERLGLFRRKSLAYPTAQERSPDPPLPDRSVTDIVWRAMEYLEGKAPVFSTAEITAIALGHAPGRHTPAMVEQAITGLRRDGHLLEAERRGMDRAFTTPGIVEAEKGIVSWATSGNAIPLSTRKEFHEHTQSLDAASRQALDTLTFTRHQVTGLRLPPDDGRFAILKHLAAIAGDRPLHGLAPTPAGTRDLVHRAGVSSSTLEDFLERHATLPANYAHLAGGVVVVDGACGITAIEMAGLARAASRLSIARVVLVADTVGRRRPDPRQPFRLMAEAGMPVADLGPELSLVETVRLIHPFEAGPDTTRPVIEVDHDRLSDEAVRLWLALSPKTRAATAILAGSPELGADIHDAMGADRAKAPGIGIERLVDRRMNRDQLADPANFQEGDVLIFRRDVHGCSRGTVSTITGVKEGKVEHVDSGGRSLSFRPTAGTFRNLAIHETETVRIHVGDRVRLASGRRTATVSAIEGNCVHLDLGRGQRLRLDHNDRRLRLLEPEWSVVSSRTTSAIAVLDSGDSAGQASFAVEVARAFDGCVFITNNRDDPGFEEHHRLARAMPRGTGEIPVVADPVIEAWRNFAHTGEDRDALMLATVMLGDDLPGDPSIKEARANLAERMVEHAGRTVLAARIDSHCRYWSDIRASGAARMLDSWQDYAASLLEEGRAMITRSSEETGTRLAPAIEALASLCRRDEVMGLLDLGSALAEGKPEGAAFYQGGWGGFIAKLKAHSAIDHDLEPAVATWLKLNEASLERRAEIETFIRGARAPDTSPDAMEQTIRKARAMMRDRERYGVHLDHMADAPLARLVTELKTLRQRSINRGIGNAM